VTELRGETLLAFLAALPPAERDQAVEERLGIGGERPSPEQPGKDLTGYHPSGVSPVVRALRDVPVVPEDFLVDLGAGLGKVVLLAHLLTGARAHGIELQPALVARARAAAAHVDVPVTFSAEDLRAADLRDGTVFYLYAPCTGEPFRAVLALLRAVAERRAIVVCALGIDMPRDVDWLVPRETDAFWLTLYDSVVPGVPPRRAGPSLLTSEAASAVVFDRAL
jgi:hypothetical protein